MAGIVVLEPSSVAVVPGGEAVCSVRIRNIGQVVDQYSLTVLGDAAAWATVIPPVMSLFPGAEGNAEIHFRPPRAASTRAGAVDFALRAVGSQDPDGSVVEEGSLDLAAFTELSARITPRTSEGKRSAHHEIVVDNKGNSPLSVEFAASDPDELLAFALKPPRLDIPAGSSAHAQVKVAARKGFMRGPTQNRQFMIDVTPDSPDGSAFPTRLDANFSQRAGMPGFILPLVVAVVAIALIVVLLPLLKKKDTVTLSSNKSAVPTTVPGVDDAAAAGAAGSETVVTDPVDPTAGKQPLKFTDPNASAPAAGGETQAATNGVAVASPAPTTPTTAAPAPANTATTAAQATTTTAAPTTTTTTAAPDNVYSSTTNYYLKGTWTVDIDPSSGTDIWWSQDTATARRLLAQGSGVAFHVFGVMSVSSYDAMTKSQLTSVTYPTTSIDGSDGTSTLPAGLVIGVKTNAGRFAKFRIDAKDVTAPDGTANHHLLVRWVTYV